MVVVLPRKADGLAAVEAQLSAERLASWMAGLETRSVRVKLPRFTFGSFFELKKTLIAMGLEKACCPFCWISLT